LAAWRRTIEKSSFACWSDLKAAFNAVDRVGNLIADYEAGAIMGQAQLCFSPFTEFH